MTPETMELWRLTRNRYGRAVYEWLADRGVTATRMYEYRRKLSETPPPTLPDIEVAGVAPDAVSFGGTAPPVEELRDDETFLVAHEDGVVRGYLFVAVAPRLEIHPLERRLSFDGAYLRRVFVHPDHRRRGIASALVAGALSRARDDGATTATVLVAADNRPSRRLFERHDFRPVRTRTYARVGPFSTRRVTES